VEEPDVLPFWRIGAGAVLTTQPASYLFKQGNACTMTVTNAPADAQ
jgi:hypothetical protein